MLRCEPGLQPLAPMLETLMIQAYQLGTGNNSNICDALGEMVASRTTDRLAPVQPLKEIILRIGCGRIADRIEKQCMDHGVRFAVYSMRDAFGPECPCGEFMDGGGDRYSYLFHL
jgi:hypothetical protein